jgi:hypothetical protein
MNIIRRTGRHVPGLRKFSTQIRSALKSDDPVKRAYAQGQVAFGSMLMGTTVVLSQQGLITGGGPKNPQIRERMMQAGWRPYAVKINGKYISLQRLEPIGMILGLAADYVELAPNVDDNTAADLSGAMIASMANNLTSRSYLMGVSNVVQALTGTDYKAEQWVRNHAASYVPNALRRWTRTVEDETMRETRTIIDAVKASIPGLSETLEPRRDAVFGTPMANTGYLVSDFVSPFAAGDETDSKVIRELAEIKHGFERPSHTRSGVDFRKFKNAQGQSAYDRLQELVSQVKLGQNRSLHQALKVLMESKGYQRLPTDDETPANYKSPRYRAVRNVLSRYRNRALREVLQEYPELADKLKDAKRLARTGRVNQ